jgi:hypothetical protein
MQTKCLNCCLSQNLGMNGVYKHSGSIYLIFNVKKLLVRIT